MSCFEPATGSKAPSSAAAAPETKCEPLRLEIPKLVPFPQRVSVGEQVVGSDHVFSVAKPARLGGNETATVTAEIRPLAPARNPFKSQLGIDPSPVLAEAFSIEPGHLPNILGVTNQPIQVRFAPKGAGFFHADLHLHVEWGDKTRESHVIRLVGTSRELDQLPANPLLPAQPKPIEAPSVVASDDPRGALSGVTAAELDAFRDTLTDAGDAAESLAGRLALGVAIAETHAAKYERMPPAEPWWLELAQVAISMGVAGVAGAVARELGPKLAKLIVPKSGDSTVAGVTDSVKDGLKIAGRAALKATPKADSSDSSRTSRYSTNGQVQFFADQKAMLLKVGDENRKVVSATHKKMRDRLGTDPALAFQTMNMLHQSLEAVGTSEDTSSLQQRASEHQWIALVARTNLGEERVNDPQSGSERVIAKTRESSVGARGMLNIEVELPAFATDVSSPKVVGASILGVAKEIADQLHGQVLRDAAIPMMLIVKTGSNAAWITRDEAGRIRVNGYIPNASHDNMMKEAQMHRNASLLVGEVLSKSLSEWNVGPVHHDDKKD